MIRICLLFCCFILSAQDFINVSIIVYAEGVASNEKIFLVSDHPSLRGYETNGFPMVKTSETAWLAYARVHKNDFVSFFITRGGMDKQAADPSMNNFGEQYIVAERDIVLDYDIKNWTDKSWNGVRENYHPGQDPSNFIIASKSSNSNTRPQPKSKPQKESVKQKVVYEDLTIEENPIVEEFKPKPKPTKKQRTFSHTEIIADGLLNRDITVYVPESYIGGSQSYPVLYFHDKRSGFGSSSKWNVENFLDGKLKSNGEEYILVAIHNFGDRSLESSSQNIARSYCKFVTQRLCKFIDQNYRTIKNPESRIYAGSGMGGMVAFMLSWEFSSYFKNAFCFSPKFEFPKFYYTYVSSVAKKNPPTSKPNIYIDADIRAKKKGYKGGIQRMIDQLESKGLSYSWMYDGYRDDMGISKTKRLERAFSTMD